MNTTLVASLLALLGLASTAEAQNNPLGLSVSLLQGAGDPRNTAEGINRGFSAADCDIASEAYARITPATGTSITTTIVDIWMVTDSTDCSTTDSRNPDTGTCRHVGSADVNTTGSSFDVFLSDIDAAASSTTGVCGSTAAAGVTVRLFAFATGNVEDRGEVGDDWGQVSIIVDPTGPVAPPLDSTTAAGDNEVTISWERVADDNAFYRIYSGGECGGTAGDGSTTDPGDLTHVKDTDTGVTSTTFNPAEEMVPVGGTIALYVAAVDQAGNEGELAGPICVTRMELSGFCDEFSDCDESGCSAGGVPSGVLAWPLFVALGLLTGRRKR